MTNTDRTPEEHSPAVVHAIEKLNATSGPLFKGRVAELEFELEEVRSANRRLNEGIRHMSARVEALTPCPGAVDVLETALAAATALADVVAHELPEFNRTNADAARRVLGFLEAFRAASA